MPGEHARLSASGSKKWLNCPGSVELEEKFPNEETSYAAEGTTAHALAELKLLLAMKRITRVTYHRRAAALDADEKMQEYTDGYRDYVLERWGAVRAGCPDAVLLVEERIDLKDYVPEGFGTGDAVIIGTGVLEVIDLKYGQGVTVHAKDNPQLMLYALGILSAWDYLYDIRTVRMHIYQPRKDNIDETEKTAEELYMWGDWVRERARLALSIGAGCTAGDYCDDGFCRARPICRAYTELRQQLARLEFRPPAELTEEEIAEVLDQSEALAKWAKTVSDFALGQALNGTRYPGFKLVEGRSVRSYTSEQAVIERISEKTELTADELTVRKVKGVSELEKLLGKKRFAELLSDLIVKPQGKPVLVRSEDKRPELNTAASAAEDFKNIIEKEN